jgi:hypothetical protein
VSASSDSEEETLFEDDGGDSFDGQAGRVGLSGAMDCAGSDQGHHYLNPFYQTQIGSGGEMDNTESSITDDQIPRYVIPYAQSTPATESANGTKVDLYAVDDGNGNTLDVVGPTELDFQQKRKRQEYNEQDVEQASSVISSRHSTPFDAHHDPEDAGVKKAR